MTAQERDILIELTGEVHGLKVAIIGNGTKGLGDRMSEAEARQDSHEDNHPQKPPERRAIIAQRALEVSIMAAVIGLITNWDSISGFFAKLFTGVG